MGDGYRPVSELHHTQEYGVVCPNRTYMALYWPLTL